MPATYSSVRQFVGIGLESVTGTAVPPTATVIVSKFDWEDKPHWLDDLGYRNWMSSLVARQVGAVIGEFSMSGAVYGDTLPWLFANILGDCQGLGTTAAPTTTLSATTAAGVTSLTTALSIPVGSTIQVDIGLLAEIRKTGTPSGAGPYTIPLAVGERPLIYPHLSGVAVTNTAAPYTSAFAVLNSAATPVYAQGQPPTHTLTHYTGVNTTSGARQFPSACFSELSLTFNAESELLHFDAKGVAWLSTVAATAPVSTPTSVTPIGSWRGLLGVGGPASGGTQVRAVPSGKITFTRMCEPDWTVQGTQTPYVIQRGNLAVTGEYDIIAADETHFTYMTGNTQPQFQFVISNGLSGANLVQLQIDVAQAAMKQAKMDSGKANIRYKMSFDAVANTTNAGGSGGGSPAKATVTCAIPANVYL